jgi:HK97 family phage portal protein
VELSDAWRGRKQQGPDYAPVIDGGLKARNFGADPTAEAAVEARREIVADIGRYFGVPTHTLNAPAGDSQTYKSTPEANKDLVRYTLQNYIGAIEDAITDLLPGGRYMEMDTYRLVRPDMLSEAQAIQMLIASQVLSRNDARELLSMPPMEDDAMMIGSGMTPPNLPPDPASVPAVGDPADPMSEMNNP